MNEAIVSIRPGALGELSAFAECWLAMFEEIGMLHEADMGKGWRGRFESYLRRRIGDAEAQFFVATTGGRIVGTAGALIPEYPFVIHGIRRGYIFGVYVEREQRGRGIATDLTKRALAHLQAAGCKRVRLHASPFGRPIYERLGFTATNEMEL